MTIVNSYCPLVLLGVLQIVLSFFDMNFSFLNLILPSLIISPCAFAIFHHFLLIHVVPHCHRHAPKLGWNVPLTKYPFFEPKNYQGQP